MHAYTALFLHEYPQGCLSGFRVTGRHNGDCLKRALHVPLRTSPQCTGTVTLPDHPRMIRAGFCWQNHVHVFYADSNLM